MPNQRRKGPARTLFEGIEHESVTAVLRCLQVQPKSYGKGDYILFQGERLDQIGYVARGSVRMLQDDRRGNRHIFATAEMGDIFGTCVVFADGTSNISFRAASPTNILFMPLTRLLQPCSGVCACHQQLLRNLMGVMAQQYTELLERMEVISQRSLRNKVLLWAEKQVEQAGCRTFASELNRIELSDYLCADRSALARELGRMRDDGLLDYRSRDNVFTLLDVPAPEEAQSREKLRQMG